MRRTLEVLNQLQKAGYFKKYAIGGAMAAIFYMEPFETEDLDIFVIVNGEPHDLQPLSAIYGELRNRGYSIAGTEVLIEGVPVQFLVAYNDLVIETVEEAIEVDYDGVMTRIASPEHLLAVMLQTGRTKDKARLSLLMEQAAISTEGLNDILKRHDLVEKFRSWTN